MANDLYGAARHLLMGRMGDGRELVESKIYKDPVAKAMFDVSVATIADVAATPTQPMFGFSDHYASPAEMQAWAEMVMIQPPHFTVNKDYMLRWFIVPRNDMQNLYLHKMLRSDEDVMHDHPWDSTSIIISGGYLEHTPEAIYHRRPGERVSRLATDAHRIELIDGQPSVSLFFTGPKYREWGFHCPKGWVHWEEFTGGYHDGRAEKGAGCGEFA